MMTYERLIRSIIEKYFLEGKADKIKTEGLEELKLQLKRLHIPQKKYKNDFNNYIKIVQAELEKKFLNLHLTTIRDSAKQQLTEIIKQGNFAINERQEKIYKTVINILETDKDIETELRRSFKKIKLEERFIETEINTTKHAINNLERAIDFREAGVEFLKYVGPSGTIRPFCKEHINKTYRIEEVEKMLNHFGQPALIYAGGYNCRHRWIPIYKN